MTNQTPDIESLATDDFRRVLSRFQGNNFIENKKLLATLQNMANQKNCTVAQFSLAWLLAQGEDIVPIPGTKKIKYLEENSASVALQIHQDELELLNQIFSPGVVKGEKYPAYLNFET